MTSLDWPDPEARSTDRTTFFNNAITDRMRDVFGTLPNAYKHLGEPIPLKDFKRTFQYLQISALHNQALESAWFRWCQWSGLRTDVLSYDIPEDAGDNPKNPTLAQLEHLQKREREYFG